MTEDQDNAGDVVACAVRVALTAAGELAEHAARRREADLREAERDSAARVATLQSQLAAERELALRLVRDVVQRGDTTTVDELMRAWEQARSSGGPTTNIEQDRPEDRIGERFGVRGPTLEVARGAREQSTEMLLIARDVELQAEDAHGISAAQVRTTQPRIELTTVGVNDEALAARALAAESHPTPVSEAARRPQRVSVGPPRGPWPGPRTEVRGPGPRANGGREDFL